MAAPKKTAAQPSAPPAGPPRWLARPASIVAAILVLSSGLAYSCTTFRDWLAKYDLWNRGATLAIEHDPKLGKLTELMTQQAEIVTKQDSRITLSENGVTELRKLKEREEERLDATRDFQRQACGEGKLDRDICRSIGFESPQ